jgi:hypothetical protein
LLAELVEFGAASVALGSGWRNFLGFYVGLKVFFQPQSRHIADLRFRSMLSLCVHTGHFIRVRLLVWRVEKAIKRMLFPFVVTVRCVFMPV